MRLIATLFVLCALATTSAVGQEKKRIEPTDPIVVQPPPPITPPVVIPCVQPYPPQVTFCQPVVVCEPTCYDSHGRGQRRLGIFGRRCR